MYYDCVQRISVWLAKVDIQSIMTTNYISEEAYSVCGHG